MTVEILDRELERLEGLWADGLSDTYHAYLETVVDHEPEAQPKLALAAALIEVGIRLTVPREVLVPLVLNTVLGFGLYYVVTRDDESCVRALSAFRQLAGSLIEPVP